MKRERKTITIWGYSGVREVVAVMVGARVAVHPSWRGDGFTISDPVTGRSYGWGSYTSEAAALRKARAAVRKFGSNPLRGSKLVDGVWVRKPPHADALRKFFNA